MIIIDTSALIALVRGEPGADRVATLMGEGVVSAVILAECLGKLASWGFDADAVKASFITAGLRVESFGADEISPVAALHRLSKQDVSLADRICLALALDRNLPVLTGDRAWADLGLPLKIDLIR